MGELAKRLDAALSLMRVWWDASLENNVRCLTEKSGYSVQNFRKERRANPGPNSFSTEAVFFFLSLARQTTSPSPTFFFFSARPNRRSSEMSAAQQDGALAEARHWFAQTKLKAVGKEERERDDKLFFMLT